jgi:uncharacterized protein YbjT (DUF2867 family)
MKVLVSGASGLVGTALMAALAERGDAPRALRRGRDWDPERGELDLRGGARSGHPPGG